MVWQMVGIGIFFFLTPHIAGWLNERAFDGSLFSFPDPVNCLCRSHAI